MRWVLSERVGCTMVTFRKLSYLFILELEKLNVTMEYVVDYKTYLHLIAFYVPVN